MSVWITQMNSFAWMLICGLCSAIVVYDLYPNLIINFKNLQQNKVRGIVATIVIWIIIALFYFGLMMLVRKVSTFIAEQMLQLFF